MAPPTIDPIVDDLAYRVRGAEMVPMPGAFLLRHRGVLPRQLIA